MANVSLYGMNQPVYGRPSPAAPYQGMDNQSDSIRRGGRTKPGASQQSPLDMLRLLVSLQQMQQRPGGTEAVQRVPAPDAPLP